MSKIPKKKYKIELEFGEKWWVASCKYKTKKQSILFCSQSRSPLKALKSVLEQIEDCKNEIKGE